MCTAIAFRGENNYFGRNLDLEYRYREEVTVTPRRFRLYHRNTLPLNNHYAIIGIATIEKGYPLYYDGTNEMGLSMAGLNFEGNAWYGAVEENAINVASFELISWVLGRCKNVKDVVKALGNVNISNVAFSEKYPVSPLHWIIADSKECVTLEAVKDGMHIYHNRVGVLTNNPPFDYQMLNLSNYMNLTSAQGMNRMMPDVELNRYSRGMGSIGLPGDVSSMSRFVRTVFNKYNSITPRSEEETVAQFFHILGSVEQIEGCVKTKLGNERTQYTSCCNTDKGIYYYKTYGNSQINAVNMWHCDLDGCELARYVVEDEERINYRN
ncbi:MAG: choloylglycine hydrolase [Lachnospiraceae bacterium]|nr:choloylglycine hydrolase [Lachnospiraceae bacterium]